MPHDLKRREEGSDGERIHGIESSYIVKIQNRGRIPMTKDASNNICRVMSQYGKFKQK